MIQCEYIMDYDIEGGAVCCNARASYAVRLDNEIAELLCYQHYQRALKFGIADCYTHGKLTQTERDLL